MQQNQPIPKTVSSAIDAQESRRGGKPCIAGTRTRVQDVYIWHEIEGMSPDEIVYQYPELALSQVYAALAYYFAHPQEIQAAFAEDETLFQDMQSRMPSKLIGKLNGFRSQSQPNQPV